MFGAAKPATGGFGAPAAPATGFGAPAAGGFGVAKPATGGFGAPTTGFGAPAAGGFGAAKPATGGFGAPTTGFGAPAAGGFGAEKPATGGFGAPTTGFGAPTLPATGFGAPAAGGFGAAKPATGGFGAPTAGFGAPAAGGFGAPGATAAAPPPHWQDFSRQSALVSYLVELDRAYDALHPSCRFRRFVYNVCGQGRVVDAIQRERYIAFTNGGGCSEEEYMRAQQHSPDTERSYPSPLHFNQELKQRVLKQRQTTEACMARVEELIADVESIAALDAANATTMRSIKEEDVMLRRRWAALQVKMEVVRRWGRPSAGEARLEERAAMLQRQLQTPGRYRSALEELAPYLEAESARCASMAINTKGKTGEGEKSAEVSSSSAPNTGNSPASSSLLLRSSIGPTVMKEWLQFALRLQDGIEALRRLLEVDLGHIQAVRDRVSAS